MKRKRYSEEQIISILKQHQVGASALDLARHHAVVQNTNYRWKAKFGGMEVSEVRRLREFESEYLKLTKWLVGSEVGKAALSEIVEVKW